MWITSDQFNDALLDSSRTWSTKIDVLYGGAIQVSLNVLIQGYIGIDNVAVRREAHFTVVDADGALTPKQANDLLTPKGTEIQIYRGLWVKDATGAYGYEYVPMGLFGVVEPQVRSHSEGTVLEIKGFDRVDHLRSLRFEDPWPIADGTLAHVALAAIVADRMPTVALRVTPSTNTIPEVVYDRLSSPWDVISDICDASGYIMFFDPLGQAVIEPMTEVDTGITYTTGEKSLLMNVSRTFTAETTYSGVIVRGEHPDHLPIRQEAWDVNPNSPTYSLGPFGRRPYGIYSTLITNDAQALALANLTLPLVSQMHQETEIYTRGHPGHDVFDVFTVFDPRSSTNLRCSLISATIPLLNTQGDHIRLRCQEAQT